MKAAGNLYNSNILLEMHLECFFVTEEKIKIKIALEIISFLNDNDTQSAVEDQLMNHRIKVKVADLRKEPKELIPYDFSHHDERLSQLILGEAVEPLLKNGEWVYIAAPEQPRFVEKWQPYTGWVREEEIEEMPESPLLFCQQPLSRDRIVQDALTFVGMPYLWGGMSSLIDGKVASVDCSGLSHLLHRNQSIRIPRDAHDQFLFFKPISLEELQPGDCFFLARLDRPGRMCHVLTYIGLNRFIEAAGTPISKVQVVTLGETIEQRGSQFYFHDRQKSYHGFFGTLPSYLHY